MNEVNGLTKTRKMGGREVGILQKGTKENEAVGQLGRDAVRQGDFLQEGAERAEPGGRAG